MLISIAIVVFIVAIFCSIAAYFYRAIESEDEYGVKYKAIKIIESLQGRLRQIFRGGWVKAERIIIEKQGGLLKLTDEEMASLNKFYAQNAVNSRKISKQSRLGLRERLVKSIKEHVAKSKHKTQFRAK